jgi:hypothetical protein
MLLWHLLSTGLDVISNVLVIKDIEVVGTRRGIETFVWRFKLSEAHFHPDGHSTVPKCFRDRHPMFDTATFLPRNHEMNANWLVTCSSFHNCGVMFPGW